MNSSTSRQSSKIRNSKKSNLKKRKKKSLASQVNLDSPLSLEQYSLKHKIPPFMLWEEIKKGKIIAREIGGEVFILPQKQSSDTRPGASSEGPAVSFSSITKKVEPNRTGASSKRENTDSLPNLPTTGKFLGLNGSNSDSPEVALLLDHLSLAKEENKEILSMAQKSLEQVKEITKEIVSAKDEVILAKEEKIKLLEEKLLAKERSLNETQQKLEDLEMLTKSLVLKK